MDYLIDFLFLLYLISGLAAGAWVFYEFLFQKAFLFKEDQFSINTFDKSEEYFKQIESRLDKMEENQRTIISLTQKYKQDAKK